MSILDIFEQIIQVFGGDRQASTPAPTPVVTPVATVVPALTAGRYIPSFVLTPPQFSVVMPHLNVADAVRYLPYLNAALAEGNLNTPVRVAAFLGQVAVESGELRWWVEFASGDAYEGRKDLGNTQPGDGPLFKGRGPIQLTGRLNYTRAGMALGLDLVNHPETVATPEVGFRTTIWYWTIHDLNLLADAGNFQEITRKINGGLTNEGLRETYWARAKIALGIS